MASLLGAAYDNSSSDDEAPAAPSTAPVPATASLSKSLKVDAAPEVSTEDPSQLALMLANPTSTALTYNARYSDLSAPAQGPVNPFRPAQGNSLKRKNVLTGNAEETLISEATFNAQHRTWQSLGYTRDPSQNGAFVGDLANVAKYGGRDVVQMRPGREESAALRKKRQKKGDASIVDGEGSYLGPWAKYQDDDALYQEEAAEADRALASDEEWVEEAIAPSNVPAMNKSATAYEDDAGVAETTELHASEYFDENGRDYQGRTYMHVPQDLDIDLKKDPGSIKNYIPKKQVHAWKSHTKPITSLRFFPRSGHVMLSASADAKIKIWDVYHSKELLRTFSGHSRAITDTDFHPTGTTFLSASYDRQMKLWDTEYGKCISKFSTGKTPHVIRFNPSPENNHEFIAGMSDKKIVQFDTRTGQMTQEYDHHLAAVNTLTFVDDNRRFISTSDDKSLRAWEYNIPVPIKFIAEPYMYPLVRAAPHPNGKFVAFQSGDNQVVVYASTDKFRQNRKKVFRGHNNAGYAIDLAFSADGQFLASGDSGGYVCFWDWKTGKMWHKILAGGKEEGGSKQNAAVTCVQWHPQETSKVATAGLDGVIKYWD